MQLPPWVLESSLRAVEACLLDCQAASVQTTTALALSPAVLHAQCPDLNFFSCCSLIFFYSKDRAATTAGAAGLAGGHHREAWTSKGPSYEDLYTQNVVINMDDQDDVHRTSLEGKSAKERPIWLRESTVQGAYGSEEMKEGKNKKSVIWLQHGFLSKIKLA